MKIIKKSKFIQILIVFTMALSVIFLSPELTSQPVFAQAETCKKDGGWVKVDGLSGKTYNYTAPEGKLVAETCYKAGTHVEYNTISPAKKSVTVSSSVKFDLSHASFRLVDEPKESTPVFTPTSTEEEKQETPTPTSTEEEKQETPTPTPTEEEKDDSKLLLSGICLGESGIQWTLVNNNDFGINFSYSANNGQNGSGQVSANGSAKFTTSGTGTQMSVSYVIDEEQFGLNAGVTSVCDEEKQSTPQPTPVDPPAGGMGPSILPTSLLPILMIVGGLALAPALIIIGNKKNILNK